MSDSLIRKNIDRKTLNDYFKYLENYTSYMDILKQINSNKNWEYDSVDEYISNLSRSDFPDGIIEEILYNKFGVTILDANYSKLNLNDSINKIYLDSIKLGNCHLVNKIENLINVRYGEKTKNNLLDRKLVLNNNAIGDRFLSTLMKINSCWIPSDKKGKYTGTYWKNKIIQNLFITKASNLIYFEFKMDGVYEDLDIEIDMDDSHLDADVAEISSFFFEYQPPIKFIKSIKKISKKRNLHWTSFLLIHVIDWIFVSQNKSKIFLSDESKFTHKNCEPYTILYQLAKERLGMYQEIGFKAMPPFDTDIINKIFQDSYYRYTNQQYNYFMNKQYRDDVELLASQMGVDYDTADKCLFDNGSDISSAFLELTET